MLRGTCSNHSAGLKAERDACNFLIHNGFSILKQRWRSGFGEIDVIASKGLELVFFEIKSSKNYKRSFLLTERQKRRCANAALYFISLDNNQCYDSFRFDYIFVIDGTIEHIQNAFYIEDNNKS
ncbi:YraN family protein [Candidatus Cyrtobacter comes]|uniref:YraN family protein n=1 Tax=Candidatus Cyrtobacter comes TaxID=675776 RepID=A0ABU5L905_9RICK|nr:YraN family protein [Candidatus Cyrtobacter comes]MDZ5762593.1 YraN family protein [Candidatus Cyrtobacter comes]